MRSITRPSSLVRSGLLVLALGSPIVAPLAAANPLDKTPVAGGFFWTVVVDGWSWFEKVFAPDSFQIDPNGDEGLAPSTPPPPAPRPTATSEVQGS